MAVAAEERTRCALCGAWIERRPDWHADPREYADDFQEHECDPGLAAYSTADQEARGRCKLSVDSVDRRRVRVSDLVGPQEVADRLGVKVQTVRAWRWRGLMPAPLVVVSGVPVWWWQQVEEWARQTGRLGGPPASE